MFSSEHAIWKFAYVGDELDDWLPYAEDLVRKWSIQNSDEVEFRTTFEVILAAYLLIDDLLPASARAAFAKVMFEIINEADVNKLRVKCLHIHPPKPGRTENRALRWSMTRDVVSLIQEGKTKTEAYKVVAEKHFKSPDTVRREYERFIKKTRERKLTGENDK